MSYCHKCDTKISSTSVSVSGANLVITAPATTLLEETKYCLILAQPVPDAGKHLPVSISFDGGVTLISLVKFGFGNIEYGVDLPLCRNRIPLYYNNDLEFVDLRGYERYCYCR